MNLNIGGGSIFDVMRDGRRVIVVLEAEGSDPRKEHLHLTFLVNFFDEVRRRMPAGDNRVAEALEGSNRDFALSGQNHGPIRARYP